MLIKAPLSYFGGKSKIAHLYPAPLYDSIIEPFAGSAAYAWLHRRKADGTPRRVWLNDLDERTYSIWRFLVNPAAAEVVETYVPETVEAGQRISDIIPPEWPGLIELCRAEANQGTQGARGVHDQITRMGAKCWKVKRKALHVIPEVANWAITNVSYEFLANDEATWFVDPPYVGAGVRYRMGSDRINYEELGWWCLNRRGQVIACENAGAQWLPFQPFEHARVSIRSRYQKADAREVMWTSTQSVESSTRTETVSPLTTVESQLAIEEENGLTD